MYSSASSLGAAVAHVYKLVLPIDLPAASFLKAPTAASEKPRAFWEPDGSRPGEGSMRRHVA